MKKIILKTAVVLFSFSPLFAFAQAESFPLSADSKTEFLAVVDPTGIKIHGTEITDTGTLSLDTNKLSGTVVADLQKADAGISVRTNHMREKYLETEKYPKATLTLTPFDFVSGKETDFSGELDFHGVKKPVSGKVTLTRDGAKLSGTASFSLDFTNFGVPVPNFAGVTVSKNVTVTTSVVAQKQ